MLGRRWVSQTPPAPLAHQFLCVASSGESGFPIWAYIAAASGAIILAVIAFFAIRRRGKNNQNDVLRRDNIDINEISADAAPASIDHRDLTLQDDGSASFI